MLDLKQLRSRIKTIKSTEKITKAMQLVSSSKLSKIKSQIINSGYYIEIVRNMIVDVASEGILYDLPIEAQKFFSKNLEKPNLLVVVTSERGLCGVFNSSIIKQVKFDILDLESNKKEIKLIVIGKKGYDALKSKYNHYIDSYFNLSMSYDDVFLQVKQRIMQMINNSEMGMCHLYFNKFKNAMTYILVKQQLLPVEQQITEQKQNIVKHYEYEKEGLIHNMINLYISGQINYALLQSRASEEVARMTAMDNATRNAKELIGKLTLELNRSRQANITKDLIEIIAGAEAT